MGGHGEPDARDEVVRPGSDAAISRPALTERMILPASPSDARKLRDALKVS